MCHTVTHQDDQRQRREPGEAPVQWRGRDLPDGHSGKASALRRAEPGGKANGGEVEDSSYPVTVEERTELAVFKRRRKAGMSNDQGLTPLPPLSFRNTRSA